MMLACVCGGVGEILLLLIIASISSLAYIGIRFGAWVKKLRDLYNKHKNCKCDCHEGDTK